MAVIINNIVFGFHILIGMLIAFVWLGNFFKKKSWLKKYHLYGDTPIFISVIVAFCLGLLIITNFVYASDDIMKVGLSLGSNLTVGIFVLFLIALVICVITEWQSNIKET